MSADYLWDGSGEPDAEIVNLEQRLQALRWSGRLPVQQRKDGPRRKAFRWGIGVAAALFLFVLGSAAIRKVFQPTATSWTLAAVGVSPSALHAGQTIETSSAAGATVESNLVGRVEIDPGSRFRIVSSGKAGERFHLDRGTIHALIWAPPTKFVVDTLAATTVDLGCQYTLSVAQNGAGFLRVETGWVAFEWQGRESFIPAGAACVTRPGHGPDTPRFLDASSAFVQALDRFDLKGDKQDLRDVLREARRRDALTLWHLLRRTQKEDRALVFDRFAQLVTLPAVANRGAVLAGNREAFDAAWDALELGDTSWWREWKRRW